MIPAVLACLRARTAWRAIAVAIGGAGALLAVLAAPAAAPATSGGQTVNYTLHVPAMVVDNLCNGEPVNLSGDLHIRETTTPARNGGYTVTSSTNGRNLHGTGLLTTVPYTGQDTENSYAYYAAPPFPATFTDVHWTKLESHGNAPNMYLVIVLKETISADGTVVPVIDRLYLTCNQPRCSASRDD